jgi:hypothetical protein
MDISGKINRILPVETGLNKNGNTWRKQKFVLTVPGQFEKIVCFDVWGDRISLDNFSENEEVKVYFDAESREYQGKYYTDLKAWKIDKAGTISQPQPQNNSNYNSNVPPPPSEPAYNDLQDDDLPF